MAISNNTHRQREAVMATGFRVTSLMGGGLLFMQLACGSRDG